MEAMGSRQFGAVGSMWLNKTNEEEENQKTLKLLIKETHSLDFPGGTVVKNPLPKLGTQVRALVQEDPTCRGATKPVRHNY